MTELEAIEALDSLADSASAQDNETMHSEAERIIRQFLRDNTPDVEDAVQRVEDRCSWWEFA